MPFSDHKYKTDKAVSSISGDTLYVFNFNKIVFEFDLSTRIEQLEDKRNRRVHNWLKVGNVKEAFEIAFDCRVSLSTQSQGN